MSDAMLIAWLNGAFVPLEEACVHVEDRGFQFADGVYEVVACFRGAWLELEAHLARLERSCREVGIRLPYSRQQLVQVCRELYRRNPFENAMVYLQVTRGRAPRAHLATPRTPTVVATVRALPSPSEAARSKGVAAITLADIRWRRCDIKSIQLLASVLAKQEAERRGAYEAFWLDERGCLLEGSSTNAFAVIADVLTTHPLDRRVLGGITRALALRLARELGIPVAERPWSPHEPALSEMFLTSTTSLVLPVVQLDGRPIGNGLPGPITRRLQQRMAEYIAELASR